MLSVRGGRSIERSTPPLVRLFMGLEFSLLGLDHQGENHPGKEAQIRREIQIQREGGGAPKTNRERKASNTQRGRGCAEYEKGEGKLQIRRKRAEDQNTKRERGKVQNTTKQREILQKRREKGSFKHNERERKLQNEDREGEREKLGI